MNENQKHSIQTFYYTIRDSMSTAEAVRKTRSFAINLLGHGVDNNELVDSLGLQTVTATVTYKSTRGPGYGQVGWRHPGATGINSRTVEEVLKGALAEFGFYGVDVHVSSD